MINIDPILLKDTCITSRIRLARNLKGYPFLVRDEKIGNEIIKKVEKALYRCGEFYRITMGNLDEIKLNAFKEKHLISKNLIENKICGSALISTDEQISIMINEEDVIREQCFHSGLALNEAYKRLQIIDDELSKNLDIAFDDEFGYLTACITNVGTGLRASVMMFLPALAESGEIENVIKEATKNGLTIRGIYGEGSASEGYMYQVSNEVTLGLAENEIIEAVDKTVKTICTLERELKEKIFLKDELKTIDMVRKSYGILTNSVLLSYNEFLHHIGRVKLGVSLGFIDIENIDEINKLIEDMRPAVLQMSTGKQLSEREDMIKRAERTAKKLLNLKGE